MRWSDRTTGIVVLLLLLAVGWIVFNPIMEIRPLRGDNLYALAWVDQAPLTSLLELDAEIYPEWRPLPYMMLWLEHRVVQLDFVAIHHLVNLLLWVTCAWLVYLLAAQLSASRSAAVLAALLVLVDARSTFAMTWIIERQTSLACCCGLAALLVVVRARDRQLSTTEIGQVVVLLLASALSKEYGLAFSGALAGHSLFLRRRDLGVAAATATIAYASLRLGFAGGALAPYCEDMGFAFNVEERCIGSFAGIEFVQMAYNVAATAVGTALPGLFNEDGMVEISRWEVAKGLTLLVPALLAVAANLPFARTFALVSIGNALLSFMLYRDRNHLIGVAALAIVMALGMSRVREHLPRAALFRGLQVAAVALCVLYLCQEAIRTHGIVADDSASLVQDEPCDSSLRDRHFGDRFVTEVKIRYGMTDPECQAAD